ncbi:hypothetical protein PR202_ga21883 [Eleusine coracana subsp. coracana]|uniref:Uncharacterized protein n=1 Tax=Eleusine coracana subsp. coracana TaxID=191504 RepID=A0AAV5D1K9_ELECO|nr:hypothetical protein PR202_ga21883 [Eleusine coracana subsp. coracana]
MAAQVLEEIAAKFDMETMNMTLITTAPEDFLLVLPDARVTDRVFNHGDSSSRLGMDHAQQLLRSTCLVSSLHPDTEAMRDLSSFCLRAWCLQRDRVPAAIDMFIPEPDTAAVEPSKRDLTYFVKIFVSLAAPPAIDVLPPPPPRGDVGQGCGHRRRRSPSRWSHDQSPARRLGVRCIHAWDRV